MISWVRRSMARVMSIGSFFSHEISPFTATTAPKWGLYSLDEAWLLTPEEIRKYELTPNLKHSPEVFTQSWTLSSVLIGITLLVVLCGCIALTAMAAWHSQSLVSTVGRFFLWLVYGW